MTTPISPPSGPVQWLFQGPPAESKLLAALSFIDDKHSVKQYQMSDMKQHITTKLVCVLMVCSIFLFCQSMGENIKISSPDRGIQVEISLHEGMLGFTVLKSGAQLVRSTSMGLEINGVQVRKFSIQKKEESSFSENWKPIWGKQSEISDTYNELLLQLKNEASDKNPLNVIFRVYNDGVAFRYEIPRQSGSDDFTLNQDLTNFELSSDAIIWAPNGEDHNIGPLTVSECTSNKAALQTPLLVQSKDGFVAVHEAAIYDFSYALIKPLGLNGFQFKIDASMGVASAKTSWRVFMIGDTAGDLFESNLLQNLNPPCAIDDPSWIKPGISFEDWRGLGTKEGDFTYGADEESYRRYIDFAAEQGIDYFIPSGWWYQTEGIRLWGINQDMKAVVKYANSKGVGIIMYIDRIREKGTDWNLEDVLKEWHSWGVKGIKYGFLRGECRKGNQELVQKTRAIVTLCAKYQMVVDFHDGPVPPSGDSRTWPNLLAREYGHAQCDSKRSYQPKTLVTAALVNGLSGSLDLGNGYFDLNTLEKRDKIWEPVPSTVVGELARNLIIGPGLMVVPDIPDAYRRKPELFRLIPMMKGDWDETRVLASEIGKYIVVARRKGDTWILGAATNEKARELQINLDFLKLGNYKAEIFSDTENTSAFGEKESYLVTSGTVSNYESYTFKMAPGGGHCMWIRPKARQ